MRAQGREYHHLDPASMEGTCAACWATVAKAGWGSPKGAGGDFGEAAEEVVDSATDAEDIPDDLPSGDEIAAKSLDLHKDLLATGMGSNFSM